MRSLFISIVLAVCLPGCAAFGPEHPRQSEVWPTYSVPVKPQLDMTGVVVPNKDPVVDKLVRNIYTLTRYAESIKIVVETHNAAANARNGKVENDLGIGK